MQGTNCPSTKPLHITFHENLFTTGTQIASSEIADLILLVSNYPRRNSTEDAASLKNFYFANSYHVPS